MFESGIGRGMGFRDSNQDLLGFVHMVPERARARILDIAATQLPDGGAYHQYQPLTKRGNDDVGSGFNDDPAWLVPGGRRLPQGDRRPGDPRRARAVRQRGGLARRRCTTTCGGRIDYTLTGSARTGCRSSGGPTGTTASTSTASPTEPGESFQTTAEPPGGVAESVFIAGLFVLAARELAAIADRAATRPRPPAAGRRRRR